MAGIVKSDVFQENTLNAGVLVEDVPIKDGLVDGRDVAADGVVLDSLAGLSLEYQYSESEAESTTTSTSYVEKLKLTTTSLPAGEYLIGWFFEMGQTSVSDTCDVKVELDDTTILANSLIEPKDATNWYGQSGFKKETLSGIHDVDIDFRQINGSTAQIRRARIELIKVAD